MPSPQQWATTATAKPKVKHALQARPPTRLLMLRSFWRVALQTLSRDHCCQACSRADAGKMANEGTGCGQAKWL